MRHAVIGAFPTVRGNLWFVAQQLDHANVQRVFRVYGKFISRNDRCPRATRLGLADKIQA